MPRQKSVCPYAESFMRYNCERETVEHHFTLSSSDKKAHLAMLKASMHLKKVRSQYLAKRRAPADLRHGANTACIYAECTYWLCAQDVEPVWPS